ncbi:MAG: glucan 1,4-alpha-glucosidase [Acidobacteria bacterium]|nr:MAG: glucan 1,4-alpha-glucosidase [Acidobacteriota bacterium]
MTRPGKAFQHPVPGTARASGVSLCRLRLRAAAVAAAVALVVGTLAGAAQAPGAPGASSSWTSGAKQGLGTSTTLASKVWYTLGQGTLNEVYYPTADIPDVQDLEFIVTDESSFVDLERDATNHMVELMDPRALTYRQINTAKSGKYRISKTYVTDPDRSTLLIETRFEVLSGGPYQLFVFYNPSLNNSGMGDSAATSGSALVASDGNVASALASSSGFVKMTSGYSGTMSDGSVDLSAHKHLEGLFDSASAPGNVVVTGQITAGSDTTFTLALGFGSTREEAVANANASLGTSFATQRSSYESGWHSYLASLNPAPKSVTSAGLTTQYNVALMTLKAHEDKTFRGAVVASLTIPWGQAVNADHCCPAGYHAVWARDLYEVATAEIAAGDSSAANRSLDYLLNVQQRPDGSFPQNARLDGTPVFGSLQMDEVAYPIVLAWQLNRTDAATWGRLKRSADFIVSRGPFTPQERWEENSGFSPSTIAAEIAGLVCAADMARKNGDTSAANTYLATADDWQHNVDNWTFTTSGPLGTGRYYERIDDDRNPNDGHPLGITNGGGSHDERGVVDAGFLEFVRLGVRPPDDARIAASLPVVDSTIKVDTPSGPMWYRYNFDGYGETSSGASYTGAGVGRLWPIFSGERGEYELANGRSAASFLLTMANAGNAGFMIPEQVWDSADGKGKFVFGKGTDSATPLAWSMAQFVRLAVSIDAGQPVERPSVVASRYALGSTGTITFTVTVPPNTDSTSKSVFLAGELDRLDPPRPVWDAAGVRLTRVDSTHWQGTLTGRMGTTVEYKYALGDWAFVEKSASCAELSNRMLTLSFGASGTQAVNESVAAWRNVPPCGN